MQVFNAKTQQVEDVTWSKEFNGELTATFADGGFVKFPAGISRDELGKLVEAHQQANEGQEVLTEEQLAADAEMDALINDLNGGTPKGVKTNAPNLAGD